MIINNDNIAVFTSKQILEGDPIMRVYCNKDDFTLEFYPDKDFNQEDYDMPSPWILPKRIWSFDYL